MRQDEDRFYSLPLRQGRDAHKNGGRIGRIVTPCRTPVPPLPARAGGRYYLNIPKYVHLQSMSQHVGTCLKARERNTKRCLVSRHNS